MRRFVEREVLPVVAERERADDYPGDLLPALAALGVLGMSIPEEHGGSAVDLVGYALVFEELARGWMGLASVVGSSQSGCWLLARFGTDDQRQRFLPDLAAGRRMSGIALTEPATGSDLKAITLRAERRGDAYVVNGTKTMITQARHADPLVVLAVTDPTVTPAHRGMSLLLVEQGTPGWTVGRDITKLGHKGVELCELAFDDAVVPAANLLGGDRGLRALPDAGRARPRPHLHGRRQRRHRPGRARGARPATRPSGRPSARSIGEHQAIKLKLAGMAIRVRAARLLTHAAAARIDREGRARSDAAMAKVFASETAIECSLEAMRVLGGYGYTTDFPVERLYRDAPLMAIGEGTNEILQLLIADELLAAARAADEGRRHGGRRRAAAAGVLDVDGQQDRRTGRCCIRGYDLEELIGGQSFTASTFLLLRGRLPSPARGAGPRRGARRRPRLRAGEAGHGRRPLHRLGQPEHGGRPGRRRPGRRSAHARPRGHGPVHPRRARPDGGDRDDRRRSSPTTLVAEARERRERIPGFGHPRFRRIDPRAQRLREIAEASGLWGDRARLYERSTGPSRPCPARPTSPSTTWA